jgi:hypothetical protein
MAEQSFFATEADHESVVALLIHEHDAAFVLNGTRPEHKFAPMLGAHPSVKGTSRKRAAPYVER